MSAPAVRRIFAVLVLSAWFSSPALAASTIPEIVVTPNYAPTPLERVGSTVSVVDSRKIARSSPASVAQLLRTVPGVTVIESGGPGGSAEVRIRGAETGHTVVLIDGVRVNDPATARGDFDFVLLTLGDVERIEVLRGPQSAIYGSDAMGGVVNIITKKQKVGSSLTTTVEGGSYGTLAAKAAGGMSVGDFGLRFSGSRVASDGFSRRGNRDTAEADGVQKLSGTLRLTYTPADGPSIDAGVTGTHEVSAYDGTGGNEPYTATRDLLSGFGKVALPTWDGWLDQSVTAFGMSSERVNLEPGGAPGAIPVSRFASTTFGGEYKAVADLAAAGTLTVGGRVEQEHAQNSAQTATMFPGFDSTRTYFAGYAQHALTLRENLHLTFSGRYDGEAGGEGFVTGRATAAYDWPDHGTRLRASVGTGAKRPTAYQIGNNLFAASIAPVGVTVPVDLKTERSIGFDAGIEQTLFQGAVHVSAIAFYNRFSNLLGFTFLPSPQNTNGYYDNTDRAETSGLELALETDIFPDVLRANVTYTWMPTRNLVTGRPLPRRPENSGSFSIVYSPDPRFEATLTGTVVGPRTNLASSTTMLPGYWRLDLSGSYALTDSTKLFGRVENLTDNRYQDPSGFNAPGLSAYVGLTWNR